MDRAELIRMIASVVVAGALYVAAASWGLRLRKKWADRLPEQPQVPLRLWIVFGVVFTLPVLIAVAFMYFSSPAGP